MVYYDICLNSVESPADANYNNKKEMLADLNKGTWIGKTIRILLPIEIEGVKNDYSFEFKVNDVITLK